MCARQCQFPRNRYRFTERLELRLSLIQPGGIGWREHHMEAWRKCAINGPRLVTGMTRTIVENQVNAFGPVIRMQQPPQGGAKMRTLILIQLVVQAS